MKAAQPFARSDGDRCRSDAEHMDSQRAAAPAPAPGLKLGRETSQHREEMQWTHRAVLLSYSQCSFLA